MNHSYHSLVPGVMVRPPEDSVHQEQHRELTLEAQHQGSPWPALLDVYQLAPLLEQEVQFVTMQIILLSEQCLGLYTKATAPPS